MPTFSTFTSAGGGSVVVRRQPDGMNSTRQETVISNEKYGFLLENRLMALSGLGGVVANAIGIAIPGTEAYVVDQLTIPHQNPYNAWMRPGGMDF